MQAVVSGRAGVALLLNGDQIASLRVGAGGSTEPCDLEDFPFLFGDAKDLEFVEDLDLPQIADRLAREHSKQMALQLVLISLDEALSIRTRRAAGEELESLFAEDEVQDFVERVLHAHVLPPSADPKGALVILPGNARRVKSLLGALAASQQSIALVQYAWEGIPQSLFGGSANHGQARAVAVREGLFRDLVRRLKEGDSLEAFVSTSFENETVRDLPNSQIWFAKWLTLLQLEEGPPYPVGITLPEQSVAEADSPCRYGSTSDAELEKDEG